MAENPVFSMDTMERAATPMSAGNPGFIDSGDATLPDYSNLMAKEKEAEVRHYQCISSQICMHFNCNLSLQPCIIVYYMQDYYQL